jgi:4-alpha-glucanotransferase
VDYSQVESYKNGLLRTAFGRLEATAEYESFAERNEGWLPPFAAFVARKMASGGASWTQTDGSAKLRDEELNFHKFVQYEFFREWFELKQYCSAREVSIIGDLPFYVEHGSSDVCSHPELFNLDQDGNPTVVGGVPPDYFSAEGQLWQTPTYRWDRLEETGYRWWIDRLRAALSLFDVVRLDHFRGFAAHWEVPGGAPNAVDGRWTQGPGAKLFAAAAREIGDLPFIAENLGVITTQVEEIRREFSFPGMAVLQFGFGEDATHRPHKYEREMLACTGTHDNDTIIGWWKSKSECGCTPLRAESCAEGQRALEYLGAQADEIHWAFIRAVLTSVADIAIIPLQDILGLGSEARMNIPGIPEGNWRWRYEQDWITTDLTGILRRLTELSSR